MGFLDLFKKEDKREKYPDKRTLDVPPAPPTAEELPSLPSGNINMHRIKSKEIVEDKSDYIEKMEARAVNEGKEIVEEREDISLKKPIFVPIDLFRNISDEISSTQNIVKENGDTIARIEDFKEDEDKEYNKWEIQIKDIQKKLIYVDKTLFGIKGG